MAFISTGAKKDPSGKILKDYWVGQHPGRPRTPKSARTFKTPIVKPSEISIQAALELTPAYWVPGRAPDPVSTPKVELAALRRKLRSVDSGIRLAWNPKRRLWGVWVLAPHIRTEWCKGWKLLFSVKPEFLDNRVLAKLYESDATRFGGAKVVYNKFLEAMARREVKLDDKMAQNARDWAGDYFDYTVPKVGYGTRNNGSKVANHG